MIKLENRAYVNLCKVSWGNIKNTFMDLDLRGVQEFTYLNEFQQLKMKIAGIESAYWNEREQVEEDRIMIFD